MLRIHLLVLGVLALAMSSRIDAFHLIGKRRQNTFGHKIIPGRGSITSSSHVSYPQQMRLHEGGGGSSCGSRLNSSRNGAETSDGNQPDDQAKSDTAVSSRREIMQRSAVCVLNSILLSSSSSLAMNSRPANAAAKEDTDRPSNNNNNNKKTIVITGCNSGIGYNAALRMASSKSNSSNNTIILACRTLAKAQETATQIQNSPSFAASTTTLVPAECDLSSLRSIQQFASSLTKTQQPPQLDVVCLNAGLALDVAAKEVARTKDGFELTVGTNHLGHFYLNSLLLPMVNPKTGRIVVTASGVHDPDSPGGAQGSKATLGDLKGLEEQGKAFTMVDGGSYDADKAYKDSKLCNVLFTRELQKRLDATKSGIKAYCFNPGLIVGTGLFRDQNPIFTKIFDVAATNILKVGETSSWGGGALEFIALDPSIAGNEGGSYYTSPPGSSKYGDSAYGNQFAVSQVSKEARDDAKARKLWALSEKLVGIA